MFTDLITLCVTLESSIHSAVAQMDVSRIGIVLVVDPQGRLLGTITDGDVRRAILANVNLEEPVRSLLARKAGSAFSSPVSASADADRATLLRILQRHRIRHLPLVDQGERVVALVTLDEFAVEQGPPLQAVIMAGGEGSRLRPLTDELPKPMLPVGGRPLLELIIEQLRHSGISRVNLTTHYRKDVIAQHFGDGHSFGVEIQYVEEDQPLGTAGALSLLDPTDSPILVINGDILTRIDFRNMLDFHREHEADMSVAIRPEEFQLPFGVVTIDGVTITGISEKPVVKHLINAGIYLLNPSVCKYIPTGQRYDMTELIEKVIQDGKQVVGFPVNEYWIDIGKSEDYQRVQREFP